MARCFLMRQDSLTLEKTPREGLLAAATTVTEDGRNNSRQSRHRCACYSDGNATVMMCKYLVVAVVFGGGILTQMASSASPALTNTEPDAQEGLLAAYHALQFGSARQLQRRLISERMRHDTAVNRLRRTHRTSMTALRRRIRELGVDVTGAVPSRGLAAFEINGAAVAGPVESAATEVAGSSTGGLPPGNRTLGIPTHESSTGTGTTSDGAARTLLQDASPAEPSCSTEELMAVQANPTAAVTGLFKTNPSCANCLVPCGSPADAMSCAMGCLKQARDIHDATFSLFYTV
jgi:hypothetical protein